MRSIPSTPRAPRRRRLVMLALVTSALLLGAFLRLYRLTDLGLAHDEVAHWLIDRQILAGQHSIYFTEAYGHEAGQHYLEAASLWLWSDNALALRLPAAFLGIVGLALAYALGKTLFGRHVGLLALAWLSLVFFPVFFSRLALRAISLPVMAAASALFFWRGVQAIEQNLPNRGRLGWLVLAGLCAGLSLYTYLASRALPLFYGFFSLYLLFENRRRPGRLKTLTVALGLFGLAYLVTASPLLVYLRAHPGAEYRVAEVSAPLTALRAGDWRPVATNAWKILGAFGWRGDPLWRQNVADAPVFTPLTAIFFYGGVGWCLWRRERRHVFILAWAGAATLPSLATVDAPSTIRMIGLLPVLTLFPSLFIHNLGQLSTIRSRLSTRLWVAAWIIGLAALGWEFGRTITYLFSVWPNNAEVKFVWQTSLTEAARALDAAAEISPVAVMGWSPDTLDPSTWNLSLRRTDLSVRFFGHELPTPMDVVILPAGGAAGALRVVRPTLRPFQPAIERLLTGWGEAETDQEFVLYHLRVSADTFHPAFPQVVAWGDELLFLGYDVLGAGRLLTYWQVLQPPPAPRSIFIHALDAQGDLISQSDGLGAPVAFWQTGDRLVRYHTLSLPSDEPVTLRLGVYDPVSQGRLTTPNGQDWVVLDSP